MIAGHIRHGAGVATAKVRRGKPAPQTWCENEQAGAGNQVARCRLTKQRPRFCGRAQSEAWQASSGNQTRPKSHSHRSNEMNHWNSPKIQ